MPSHKFRNPLLLDQLEHQTSREQLHKQSRPETASDYSVDKTKWVPSSRFEKTQTIKNKSLLESNILGNEHFQPSFKFCMQVGTQGGCTKMPFLKVAALLLPW